ncbi:hypothetical protein ASG14_13160 [Pedobacter sp. Leaf194]|nr:hypothetical protein ASG14_13160 [Pedobacter sp. Leaf194]
MEVGIITVFNKIAGFGYIKYGNLLIKFHIRSTHGNLFTYDTVNFDINYDNLETTAINVRKAE